MLSLLLKIQYFVEAAGEYWVLIKNLTDYDTKYTYIDRDGHIIYECITGKDSDIQVSRKYPYVIYKSSEDKVYCFADEDFTISATADIFVGAELFQSWFGLPTDNSETVNVFTGETFFKGEILKRHTFEDDTYLFKAENDGTVGVYKLILNK